MNRIEPKRTALLMIDMEKGFVEPGAALSIAGAKATVPTCARMMDEARAAGVQIIWVKRIYAADYSDMEVPRREALIAKGRYNVLAPGSTGLDSIEEPDGLVQREGDWLLIKPRYSAFFKTGLDEKLRNAGIDTVLIGGTTTPNCIRSTCYDAISYDFRAVVLEQCCSSNTDEIQRANMIDMRNVGADIYEEASLERLLP